MSRTYHVTIGASIGNGPQGPEIIEREEYLTVYGHTVNHVMAGGTMLLCQIVNTKGEILFSAPASIVKHVWSQTYSPEVLPQSSPGVKEAKVIPLIIRRNLKNDV